MDRPGIDPVIRPFHSSFRPLVLVTNISLRLERRGAVVSALTFCLPCNSNDVYRSCYRGYILFLSFPISFCLCRGSRTRPERRKYRRGALIRLGGTLPCARARVPRRDKEIHSPQLAGVQRRSAAFIYRLARLPG